jgi:hypothetical protein
VTAQGHPLTRFRRAIETRSVFLAELAARECGALPLEDALGLVELYAATRDRKYDAAARRWLVRYAVERQPMLVDLQLVAAALEALPARGDAARCALREISRG